MGDRAIATALPGDVKTRVPRTSPDAKAGPDRYQRAGLAITCFLCRELGVFVVLKDLTERFIRLVSEEFATAVKLAE